MPHTFGLPSPVATVQGKAAPLADQTVVRRYVFIGQREQFGGVCHQEARKPIKWRGFRPELRTMILFVAS